MSEYNHDPQDRVWYACYGSNLSSERFSLYIQGGDLTINGVFRHYDGCTDKTLWTDSQISRFPGRIYFGHKSDTWLGKGVAFYKPYEDGTVLMRLYQITWGQLLDVQKQEGKGRTWYGNLVDLGVHNGLNAYTITAHDFQPQNDPCPEYRNLILHALTTECGMDEESAKRYLEAGSLDPTE